MALNFACNQGKGKQSEIIDPWSTLWNPVPTVPASSSSAPMSSSSAPSSTSASSSTRAVALWLPDELWLAIFSALTSSKDHYNLSLTDRHFNQIATPLLVRSLYWRKSLSTLTNLSWWDEHPEGRPYVRQVVLSIGGIGTREDELRSALNTIKNSITVGASGNAARWGAISAHSDNIYPYILSQVSHFTNLSKLTLTDAELPSSLYNLVHSLENLIALTIVRCMLPGIPRSHPILQQPSVSRISKIGLEDISILDARGLLGLPATAPPQPPLNNPGVFGVAGFNPPLPPNNPNNNGNTGNNGNNATREQAFHPLTLLPSIHLTSLRIHWRGELALSLINFAFPLPHLTSLTIHIKNLTQFVLNPVMSFIRGFQGSLEELNVMVESLAKSLEMQAVMAAMAVAGPAGAANVVVPAAVPANANANGANPVILMVGPGGANIAINANANVNIVNANGNVVAQGGGGGGAGSTGTLVMRRLKKFRGPVLIANAISAGQQQVFLDRARHLSYAQSSSPNTASVSTEADSTVPNRHQHIGVEEWELHGPITLGSFLDFLEHCTAKEEVKKLTALLQHWNTEALMAVSQLMTGLKELCLVWASGAGPNDDFLVSVGPEILPRLPFLEVLTLVPEAPYLTVSHSTMRPDSNPSPPRGRHRSHPSGGPSGGGSGGNDPFLSSSAMLEVIDIDDGEDDIEMDVEDVLDGNTVASSPRQLYRGRARTRRSATSRVEADEERDSVGHGHDMSHNNDEMPRSPSRSYRSVSPGWRMEMDNISAMAGGSQDPIHQQDPELLDIVIREVRDAGHPYSQPRGGSSGGNNTGVSERDGRRTRDNDTMGDRMKKTASDSNSGPSNIQEPSTENESANVNPNQYQHLSMAGTVMMTPEYVGDLLAGWRRFSGELREVCLVRRNVWRRIELEDRSQGQTYRWRSSASSMSSMTSIGSIAAASVSASTLLHMDMDPVTLFGSSGSGSFSFSPPSSSSSSSSTSFPTPPSPVLTTGSSTPLSNLSHRGFDFDTSTVQGSLSPLSPISPPPLLSHSGWLPMDSGLAGSRNGGSKGKGKGKGRGDDGRRKPKNRWEHFYCDEGCIPTLRVHPLSQDGWMD